MRPVQDGKRVKLLIGGKVNGFIPNPTFDPIIVPGCLDPLFRGQIPEGVDPRTLMQVEPLSERPSTRTATSASRSWTSRGSAPRCCSRRSAAASRRRSATTSRRRWPRPRRFNRWLEEDWGFDHEGRILAAPMLSLADPDAAVAEVDSLLERGARIVHVRPAPVPGPNGTSRSLGDKLHDPVWARLAEAGVPVAFHLGDSGYEARFASAWGGTDGLRVRQERPARPRRDRGPGDPRHHRLAGRPRRVHSATPTLRVASIENGSDWLHVLAKHLRKQANQTPWVFAEDPLDTLRRHVWVTPYLEEDLAALAELIGVERILFGSDWPHGEGVAQPLDFAKELGGFDEHAVQRIMRDNCLELLGTAP